MVVFPAVTRRWMASTFLRLAVLSLGTFAVLRLGAQTSVTEAVILAAIVYLLLETRTKVYGPFDRFRVSIEPKWSSIHKDHPLSPEDLRGLADAEEEEDTTEYARLKKGLDFTVLEPNLAYSNTHRAFFSDLQTYQVMPGSQSRFERTLDDRMDYVWSLRVKLGKRGYEFGVATDKKSFEHFVGVGEEEPEYFTLATLPYEAFSRYWDRHARYGASWAQRQVKGSLQRHGWTEKERCIEHKYFTVHHASV
jgi:hypothetical protein